MIDTTLSRRKTINGVEIAWDTWGDSEGPALVLCHGYTGSSHDFALHIAALAEHRRVIALDLRGHGLSQNVGSLLAYSIEQLASDLVEFLCEVGGGPVHLLGHSLGGRVVMEAALQRPDLIRSLVLMDTSAWSFTPDDEGLRTLIGSMFDAYDPSAATPMVFPPGPEDALIETTTPQQWRDRKDEMTARCDPYAIKALAHELFVSAGTSLRPRLGEITCPTLVLVGSLDGHLAEQAPHLAAEVGQGSLVVIDGGYHSPQLTHQQHWLQAIETHLLSVTDAL